MSRARRSSASAMVFALALAVIAAVAPTGFSAIGRRRLRPSMIGTRRSFLVASGSAVAACLAFTASWGRVASGDPWLEALRTVCGDPEDAAPLARSSCWTPDRAWQLLRVHGLPLDPGRLRAQLDERIRQDFAAGRTQSVDGWLLSNTEVAIGVLVASPAS